jgi:hypothetical protein
LDLNVTEDEISKFLSLMTAALMAKEAKQPCSKSGELVRDFTVGGKKLLELLGLQV